MTETPKKPSSHPQAHANALGAGSTANSTAEPNARILCEVYKSLREDEMYVFVDKNDQLSKLPTPLLNHFGETQLVTTIVLSAQRKLARADVKKVMAAIKKEGFYLQMPPSKLPQRDTSMEDMGAKNEKLPR